MAETITPDDIDVFLDNAAWAICSTYYTILKASPGVEIFGRNMLFNIPLIADWNKIGDYRQRQTNLSRTRKNSKRIDYDYEVGNNVLLTGRYSPQSRKPTQQRAMDYHDSSYEWNYQDSMQDTIGKT